MDLPLAPSSSFDPSTVEGWLTETEGQLLRALARCCSGAGCIVEIGSWMGKSTIWLAQGTKAGRQVKIYAVDPHSGSPEHQRRWGGVWTFDQFMQNIRSADVGDVVFPIVTESHVAAQAFVEPVELLFIDGAHEFERVRDDFRLWAPKLVNGGVIVLHDTTNWVGPRRVTEDFIYRSKSFINIGLVDSITFAQSHRIERRACEASNLCSLALWHVSSRRYGYPRPLRRTARTLMKRRTLSALRRILKVERRTTLLEMLGAAPRPPT